MSPGIIPVLSCSQVFTIHLTIGHPHMGLRFCMCVSTYLVVKTVHSRQKKTHSNPFLFNDMPADDVAMQRVYRAYPIARTTVHNSWYWFLPSSGVCLLWWWVSTTCSRLRPRSVLKCKSIINMLQYDSEHELETSLFQALLDHVCEIPEVANQ